MPELLLSCSRLLDSGLDCSLDKFMVLIVTIKGFISCRYEIRDIRMPARVQEAMQMQVEAERKKRAAILESEGIKTAEINVAEGRKQSKILESGKYTTYNS